MRLTLASNNFGLDISKANHFLICAIKDAVAKFRENWTNTLRKLLTANSRLECAGRERHSVQLVSDFGRRIAAAIYRRAAFCAFPLSAPEIK